MYFVVICRDGGYDHDVLDDVDEAIDYYVKSPGSWGRAGDHQTLPKKIRNLQVGQFVCGAMGHVIRLDPNNPELK